MLLSKYLSDMKEFFGTLQSGVAKSVTERKYHLIDMALDVSRDEPYLVTFDFANAFNGISRASIRDELAKHFPHLLPYFDLRYRNSSRVHFFSRVILAREGVRQGEPWCPIYLIIAPYFSFSQARI